MSFIEAMREAVDRLAVFGELDVDTTALPESAMSLSDRSVRDLLGEAAGVIRQASLLQSVLAGVASSRSSRDRGHSGLVQESGHRNAVEFLRDLTGTSRGEAIRAVKTGEALIDGLGEAGTPPATTGEDEAAEAPTPPAVPWHQPLRDGLLSGALSTAQHDAIRRGLGQVPVIDGQAPDDVNDAWRSAAQQLAHEATTCTVEDLAARARAVRDMLDPVGCEERFAARFAKRSYRSTIDAEGQRRGYIVYDDEMGTAIDDLFASALRPRRGGPRFVASDEKDAAEALVADPRTNDQLAYDLFVDLLRAGALANAKDVYGTREAGVRLVALADAVTGEAAHRDAFGRLVATAHSEDEALAVPGSVLERALCATGVAAITFDTNGAALDLGREARLFTPKQKLALAVRDGGCLWPGCDRPPTYCEAHHCDHWADGGRTDCSVGVLLCRFHHLHLHNTGWRITREDDGHFLLHAPPGSPGAPIPLQSKSPLRWLWDPPDRASWRDAA